jgi:hypothetical protein
MLRNFIATALLGAFSAGGIGGPDSPNVPDPAQVYKKTITLNAAGAGADGAIVGSAAGSLAHASGVTAVAAVSNKRIAPVDITCRLTFGVAGYTAGGSIYFRYADMSTANAITGTQTAANSLGAATDRFFNFPVASTTVGAGVTGVGQALVMQSGVAYTNTGSSTSTVTCYVYYRLLDA